MDLCKIEKRTVLNKGDLVAVADGQLLVYKLETSQAPCAANGAATPRRHVNNMKNVWPESQLTAFEIRIINLLSAQGEKRGKEIYQHLQLQNGQPDYAVVGYALRRLVKEGRLEAVGVRHNMSYRIPAAKDS